MPKIVFSVDFSHHWYLSVMNAHHDFTADDFPTFKIDQNESIDVGPSTSRALILQEPVIYFNQSAEDPTKYSKIAEFFSPTQLHSVSA